jgi:hypothetical protein
MYEKTQPNQRLLIGLHTLVPQPHIVVENDVRKHYLKLARRPVGGSVMSNPNEKKKRWAGGDHIEFLVILWILVFAKRKASNYSEFSWFFRPCVRVEWTLSVMP